VWNPLAENSEPVQFQDQIIAGTANFGNSDLVAATRLKQLAALGQADQFGTSYNDANSGFALGKGVFYLQGIWALPALRADNPKIKLGSFAFPATNNPSQNKLISGIDSLLAMCNTGDSVKEAAAKKFIDFLLVKKNAAEYANVAGGFSTVLGVKSTDKAISGLQSYIDSSRVMDVDAAYYPPAMSAGSQYQAVLQGALIKNQSAASIVQQLDSLYQTAKVHQ
jgi:raffinose/stachyose/melibiose transport system substrate-binding protein